MQNQVEVLTLTNDDDGICASQASAGGGALTINGALATAGVARWNIDTGQIITVTSAGNDSGITFTITGPDPDGRSISQTITGSNGGAAVTTYFFTGATSVVASGAVATTVKVGVVAANGAVGRSKRINSQQPNFKIGLFADMSAGASMTYTVQYAYQQPEDEYSVSYSTNANWRSVDGLTALTADGTSNIFYAVNAIRGIITTYSSGTLTVTATQSM